jgi:uncharacterized protein YkwD
MRPAVLLTLSLAATSFLPCPCHAQGGAAFFVHPFQYTDLNGLGTLTLTPANQGSTKATFQPIQVGLVQNNITYPGSGVYHYLGDDGPDAPPLVLLAFYVLGPQGNLMFFQGSVASHNGYAGGGTYYPAAAPLSVRQWSISTNGAPSLPTPAPTDPPGQVLTLLNQVRLHSGLAPLKRSSALDAAAMDQARDMAAHNFLGNQGSDGSSIDQRIRRHGYQPSTWGQWAAAGLTNANDFVIQGTGDRRIEQLIVTAGYTECGIALVTQPGSAYGTYWCVVFAAPQ